MHIRFKGQTLYSLKVLSRKLEMDITALERYLHDLNIKVHEVEREYCIAGDGIKELCRHLFHDSSHKHKYEIPEHLKNCSSPWAISLVKMYQEEIACPASLAPSQGDLIRTMISNIAPKTVLEIGCFIGISTIWIAAGLEQVGGKSMVHSVDMFDPILPHPPFSFSYLKSPLDFAMQYAQSAQLSHRIKFHKMDSRKVVDKIEELTEKTIDFLFIDGDHTIEGCRMDFELCHPYVTKGGYILLHDIYPEQCGWCGPRFLIDNYVKKSSNLELVEINTTPSNYGIALIRKLN